MKIKKQFALCIFLLLCMNGQAQETVEDIEATATATPHEYKSTKFKGMSKFQRINTAEEEISSLRSDVNSLKSEMAELKKEIATLEEKLQAQSK